MRLHNKTHTRHFLVWKSWADTRCIISSVSTVSPGEERSLAHIQTAMSVNYRELPCLRPQSPNAIALPFVNFLNGTIVSLTGERRDLTVLYEGRKRCIATGRVWLTSTAGPFRIQPEAKDIRRARLHSCSFSERWSSAVREEEHLRKKTADIKAEQKKNHFGRNFKNVLKSALCWKWTRAAFDLVGAPL